MGWKSSHAARLRRLFGVEVYDDRAEFRLALDRLLQHNRAIHAMYGPESPAAANPASDAVETWRREIRRSLIPNNRKIVELLDANMHLLDPDERATAAAFRVHADAFEARHLHGEVHADTPRYPAGLDDLAEAQRSA